MDEERRRRKRGKTDLLVLVLQLGLGSLRSGSNRLCVVLHEGARRVSVEPLIGKCEWVGKVEEAVSNVEGKGQEGRERAVEALARRFQRSKGRLQTVGTTMRRVSKAQCRQEPQSRVKNLVGA